MSTAGSWSSAGWRSVADVGHLLRFRTATARRRSSSAWVPVVLLGFTAAACVVPAYAPGADVDSSSERALNVLVLLPVGFAAFLALAVVSAMASGGGRELLPRDQAVAFPVGPATDHLGALLLAPLNIAWLIQAWLLLGSMAYALGPTRDLVTAQIVVLLWLLVATAIAQVVAWSGEAVRRLPRGIVTIRVATLAVLGAGLGLHLTGNLTWVLDRVPTLWFVLGGIDGFTWRWAVTVSVEIGLLAVAVLVGVVPARLAARRFPHDELRIDSGQVSPRPGSRSDLLALIRTDRGSVWRSVPMRRGMAVLAVGPGLVAFLGGLPWNTLTVLPGLVASGGALLFGVNAWCLDGRGSLWRENLPVRSGTVFAARSVVLAEFLLIASGVSIALGSLRAGTPSSAELTALACTTLVVTVQVVSASMRWSGQRPYAVDLRSARATPAPPLAMVGYSARLAVCTTLTGLVFSGLARVPAWQVSVIFAIPFLCWSMVRLLRAGEAWGDPVRRSGIVVAVTG